ncbi:hypothetical protein C2R22_24160 (plasmid) [Salinigranum rubrum]|uniref:Capsule synthesis protein CapA domain-containing protein n=1 Tax=Salinigranum rubrum TaxID=755307 RepID=A0A2I8VRU1_9EURY|nr:hypothetical protein C2R22_24160 [Salinigranum rubrum]
MSEMTVTIAATGDVMIDRDDPNSIFTHVRDRLQNADITLGQLETAYSHKGPWTHPVHGAQCRMILELSRNSRAGFDVISLASNHILDWGWDAVENCQNRLQADGIEPIGAGEDREAAARPAVMTRSGTRIAFLSFYSVAPDGYYAAAGKPGIAPMRAITHYEQVEPD